ncbi:MqnA/MqnD/SBP family protein [Campylobacter sp. MIT 97-5078]|uniref:MqnA/MqnD/SBP family protein n=1 Tax=Campylobacter sp. MIT 97-5078 TaxID=1548153 RepID=UPI000513BF22|nr:MqnA/MqnD/SBP family protein [Campylobacter sp. MIT 97-5078]KGI56631.1 menaquinone via futalosine step 1 [Campylobacter sp. MIT 97-5078]TQR27154.1 menaquinone via futalosine step 1 [Campylobacter sp. MIT 97-5078]
MIFGKIDYINLLPLHIYLKKYPLPNGFKKAMEYKKGVPSKLNIDLFFARIDAAVISSIESARKKYQNLDFGICANKKVKSVLVEKNTKQANDTASATSNVLARVLKQKGRVIIGDKALNLYLKEPNAYVDLCECWHKKTNLPFVFARFSCLKKKALFAKILSKFDKEKTKIPNYILKHYAQSRGINEADIKAYLRLIYYDIKVKEKRALKRFLKEASKL